MIKARGISSKFGEFVLFGLSNENLDRLRKDQPIVFDGRPYGIPMHVVIMAGETEMTIAAKLKQNETKVNFE